MAKQTINVGTSANKGDGDPLRTAFGKINDNFDEVYGLIGATGGDTDDVVAPMLVHDQHTNVTVTRDDDANIIIFSVDQVVTDLKGTIFGDDSTVLVDGVNSTINLDGTVKGDIVPDTDVTYDLGSATKRFRDLYLSGSTIDLGGTTLSVVGGELQLGGVKVPTTADPVQTSTISGVTDIVSGASPDQYMYLSTTSGGTTFTNIALKYSSVYTAPINELMGATVVEELKVGNTIEIAYAPTILASTNPGTSTKIDMDIMAGSDNTSGPVKGQINIGENNTEVINIGTTGIASGINIGDSFSSTTTNINGNVYIDSLNVTGDTVLGFPSGTTTVNGSIEITDNVVTNSILNTGNITIKSTGNGTVSIGDDAATDGVNIGQGNIVISNSLSRTILNGDVNFGNAGTVSFQGATITNWTDPNIVNEHSGSAGIIIGQVTASMDALTVRITENTPGEIDVEFNYDAGVDTGISANGDNPNRFNGIQLFTAGNTTWTTMNVLTAVGAKGEFTVVDQSYHKIYRVTTFVRALPGGGDAGDAYCVIERLK